MFEWFEVFKKRCNETSQAHVARELGYSNAVVNLVYKEKYSGDLNKFAETVMLKYSERMQGKVNCPVLGEITKNVCLEEQQKPYNPTNFQRVALFKECAACPNNCGGKKS